MHTITHKQAISTPCLMAQHIHTHNRLRPSWILSRNTSWAGTRKVNQEGKTNLDLLEQEIVSGNGISWAICKSAPWPKHITTPASHHSVFYRLHALPAAQPTASKHWRHSTKGICLMAQVVKIVLIFAVQQDIWFCNCRWLCYDWANSWRWQS